jgi:hypothetical protein
MKEEILTAKSPKIVWSNFKGEKPGLGFEEIYIEFDSMPFTKGNVISYDLRDGVYLFINKIINNMIICTISSTNKEAYLPQQCLKNGVKYYQLPSRFKISKS